METTKLACPACGEEREHRRPFIANRCPIWVCGVCGLGRAEAADFDPNAYYTEEYFNGHVADGYSDYVGSAEVLRREFAATAQLISRWLPKGGKLLEIGCAYGFFLEEARRKFDVSGIEICTAAVAACRERGLDTVHEGAADDALLAKVGDVDALVLLDVIEHLPSPHETLELGVSRLRPGGVVVVTTGNFGSLTARLMGRRWRLMTPPQHLWFFTQASLRRLGERLGLEVVAASHPWKIVPLSLIAYQLRRAFGMATQSEARASWMSSVGLPVNLFDAMRVVLRKPS
jgi:2-polyprenyl-3-methyl-5-hydroxy-6-metoxy-1,4-benzoquinol methylase